MKRDKYIKKHVHFIALRIHNSYFNLEKIWYTWALSYITEVLTDLLFYVVFFNRETSRR